MKKKHIGIILIILIILAVVFILLRGNEDNWIKDSRGVWIKHGNPRNTPVQALEQQTAIDCALELYYSEEIPYSNLSSQCLGRCEDYAIDIVHVPRTYEDNLPENQCSDFIAGRVDHFIELSKNGDIVKIA
jgi:hypothetical protein